MAKEKDKGPFVDPLEGILGIGPGRLKEKVHREPAATKDDLLTSKDLFGEIIEELEEAPTPGAPPEGPSAQEEIPEAQTAGPLEIEENPEPPPAGPRPDTVSVRAPEAIEAEESPRPDREVPSRPDSLVEMAYSTLLDDSRLNQHLENLSAGERTETPGAYLADYGQYALLERIAIGGMAEVFRAKRKGVEGFEKVVAVKRILPHLSDNKDFVEMFVNEAKMVAGLSHPNIVHIFDLGKIENTFYIAMEYVDGRDLRTILAQAREGAVTLDVDLAALIASKVVSALAYAHRQRDAAGRELRIVHRDVSPQNILISYDGEVKLVDFGIAKAAIKASHTDSGSLRGKLLYMSPEQAWGRGIDHRSDIFSLGVVFFEMLTGHSLFMGTSEMSILERVRAAHVPSPSTLNPAVPDELETVVLRALRREPADRYQDASVMARDLEEYLRQGPAVGSSHLARLMDRLFSPADPAAVQPPGTEPELGLS